MNHYVYLCFWSPLWEHDYMSNNLSRNSVMRSENGLQYLLRRDLEHKLGIL